MRVGAGAPAPINEGEIYMKKYVVLCIKSLAFLSKSSLTTDTGSVRAFNTILALKSAELQGALPRGSAPEPPLLL